MHVLIVEDDAVQAEAIAEALRPLGHQITCLEDGEQAIRLLKTQMVDVAVLDWQLPRRTGLEVLRWTRANIGSEPAVLFVTSKVLEDDIVQALEAGADDYIVKPFRVAELTARVSVMLRRIRREIGATDIVRIGEYTVDPNLRTVMLRDQKVDLTAKEFDLIAFLFSNAGKLLSREVMAMSAWGRELSVASRTLDTHIYRIRQKLFLNPENGVRLSSIYTHGYRLDEVKELA
jgi:DNA-binding response OmpR family regulator